MSCKLCEAFLHDYFLQPLEKENPLYHSLNHKYLEEHIHEVVSLFSMIYQSSNRFLWQDAKSNADNYSHFMKTPDSKYQAYDIYYQFLKRNRKLNSEIEYIACNIYDLNIIQLKRTDKTLDRIHMWIAFILGSIEETVYDLHEDHSTKKTPAMLELKPLPGRPKSARRKPEPKKYLNIDDLDDLYT